MISISLAILLGIILSIVTVDISSIIAVIVLMSLIVISMIGTEYDVLNRTEYVSTPLITIERKYSEIVERYDEIEFLGINPEERLALKEIVEEYEEAIDLLKTGNEN